MITCLHIFLLHAMISNPSSFLFSSIIYFYYYYYYWASFANIYH